jgi:hypothetical protein
MVGKTKVWKDKTEFSARPRRPWPGGEMNDATFLRECGIEIDFGWLLESAGQDERAEIYNHLYGLLSIADLLLRVPSSTVSQQKLMR